MAKNKDFKPIGFILYENEEFDWDFFLKTLSEDYGITTDEKVSKDTSSESLIFDVDGATMIVSFMPFPVPNGEAEENAKNNFLWQNGAEQVKKHKSQIILAFFHMNEDNPTVENYKLFIKFADSLLKCPSSVGIYTNATVYPSEFYCENAEVLKDNEDLPVQIMIYIGLYADKNGICGYTYGLKNFGYREIEILDSKQSPGDVYGFLCSVSEYVLAYDVMLRDNETIGFSAEQKLPIRLSVGKAVEGQSLKIGF